MKLKKKILIGLLSIMILVMIFPNANACSGSHTKKGKRVTIIRDDYGVPHIFARTREGLAFGLWLCNGSRQVMAS